MPGQATQSTLLTLTKRAEFLSVRGGTKWSTSSFVLETKKRSNDDAGPPRFGFTVTKQLGTAVIRNRIRRRLKEAVRTAALTEAKAGFDYVIIARKAALTRGFAELAGDVSLALAKVHKKARPGSNARS